MAISLGNSMPGGAAEGRLASASSFTLDAFCQALLALPDVPQPLSQPDAVIAGLTVARAAAADPGSQGDGFWTFTREPGGFGGRMTLRRDAAELVVGFQLDGQGSLHGMFQMSYNGDDQGFSLEQAATGWVLRKWRGDRQVEFPLPAGVIVPWNVDPHATLWSGVAQAAPPSPDVGAPAEIQWHYLRGGAAEGPIAESALRTLLQTLPADTPVWNPALPAWKSAKEAGLVVPPAPPEPVLPPPAAPPAAPTGWELAAVAGPAAGRCYAIAARIRLGAGADCDVRVPDPSVAPVHALLMEKPDGFWIADKGTGSGTFVNGARVQGPTLLAAGDTIRVGATELVFRRAAR